MSQRSLGVERKQGGNLHPWLNIDKRSIANKYPEGKLKSTSKGEFKELKPLRGSEWRGPRGFLALFKTMTFSSLVKPFELF